LVRAIESRIKDYSDRHPSTLSGGKRDRAEVVKTFDWTRQTIELLKRLRKTLSETNKQWEYFNSENGDVDYFSESTSSVDCATNKISAEDSRHQMPLLLCEIGGTFQRLQTLLRSLDDLSASCEDSAKALKLRLSLESNEDTQLQLRLAVESNEAMKTNGASTDFQIFILFPIAVAAACLQYSPKMMPLPAAPAVVVLTAIFIVTIKLLHAIFRRLPALSWYWEQVKAAVKAMKLNCMGGAFISDDSSSTEHTNSSNIDRTTIDVEKGTLPR